MDAACMCVLIKLTSGVAKEVPQVIVKCVRKSASSRIMFK